MGGLAKGCVWGHLVGSVSRTCNCWSWGCEFKPRVGHGAYLKQNKTKQNKDKDKGEYMNRNGGIISAIFASHLLQPQSWHNVPSPSVPSQLYMLHKIFFLLILIFFKFICFEREKERAGEGQRENPKQALCWQCRAWWGTQTHEMWDHALSWNQESDA